MQCVWSQYLKSFASATGEGATRTAFFLHMTILVRKSYSRRGTPKFCSLDAELG